MANKIEAGKSENLTKRGRGRPKGAKNKTTVAVKEALSMAADKLGGVDRLVEWAQEDEANERVFWSQMYTKLLPHQIEGTGENGEFVHKITREIITPK